MTDPTAAAGVADDQRTTTWWTCLRAVATANVALWWIAWTTVDPGNLYQTRQIALAAVFTLVCAYRSWLPRIDLERFCLVDSPASSIFLGRSAATVAEVSFAAQTALWLHRVGELAGLPAASGYAYFIVPLLALAQVFCWTGVTTLNHVAHAIEESLWAGTMAGVMVCLAAALPRLEGLPFVFVATGVVCLAGYVLFMALVDVPMYVRRWRQGRAAGARRLSLREGLVDAATRRVVTRSWAVWKPEVAWLTGYFTFAVWVSLALVHFPGR